MDEMNTRKQLEIVQEQAKAAQDSADFARRQLGQTERALRLDQWPYMWASKIELTAAPVAAQPLGVNITFKNIGKSPAESADAYRNLGLVSVDPYNASVARAQMEALFKGAKQKVNQGRTQTVPPGEDFFTSTQVPVTLTEQDLDLIQQGLSELVVVGGVTYKNSAGNVIAEPSPLSTNSTYDGEECNTGYTGNGNTATYTCDGTHMRVEKVVTGTNAVTTVAIRSGGQVIAEYDNSAAVTSPTREYLYGNNLLAIVTGSSGGAGGTIIYQHRDTLSPRLYTDVNGNDVGEQGTYPFGESWYNNNTTSNWVFTSYERDQESGNDYALARSYANGQGRFSSPDPLEGVVGDPQSWNRYAYVENDPINLSDPSGQGFWEDLRSRIYS